MREISETWLPVIGFEGLYEVSDRGSVRSRDRVIMVRNRWGELGQRQYKGQLLRPSISAGYLYVHLGRRGKFAVHHLVLASFVGECPSGQECRHLDDDPTNNTLANLKWGTRTENNLDRTRNGINHNANKSHCRFGHPFDEANTYVRTRGGRQCRACVARWQRERTRRLRRSR